MFEPQKIECPTCNGEGEVEAIGVVQCISIVAECPPDPVMDECEDCQGEGWREMTAEEEAAAERQAEEAASEPPVTMAEQHRAAWDQKQALRS